jgi:formate dehydrogenase iron-sulfur subunit
MANSISVFVPRETSAVSLGADEIADRILSLAVNNKENITLIRNGSWGMCWLEPLIEVDVNGERIAYGPICIDDVADLFKASFLKGGDHTLKLGKVSDIPYLKNQDRWTFRRCGLIDPVSIHDYCGNGGFDGFIAATKIGPGEIIEEIKKSGLRGRGGAGFPTGIKWQTVANASGDQKYIACNADEGDSGTFSDRMLMEGDPFCLIEGMMIAGFAVGANRGYIYLRSEYPLTREIFSEALNSAKDAGWLGKNIQGSGF